MMGKEKLKPYKKQKDILFMEIIHRLFAVDTFITSLAIIQKELFL